MDDEADNIRGFSQKVVAYNATMRNCRTCSQGLFNWPRVERFTRDHLNVATLDRRKSGIELKRSILEYNPLSSLSTQIDQSDFSHTGHRF